MNFPSAQTKSEPLADRRRLNACTAALSVVAADTKGSINLRIESATRQLIDDAAAVLGKTRTEFMVESARRQAVDERGAAPGKVRRNAPDLVPVSIIGRLAASLDHAGKGLGADLLSDALRRIALASQSIGIGAVMVQAKDEAAKRFCLRCAEFIEYPEDRRTLFLPIETVVAGFG